MAKDPTQVLTAGPNCRLWLAPLGSTEPAHLGVDFNASWFDMGLLEDPPDYAHDKSKTDLEAWNAAEPIRSLLDSETNTVGLKLMQSNRKVLELFYGPLVYTLAVGSSVEIEPDPDADDPEYMLCLELVDGSTKLRIFWRRSTVDTTGTLQLDKADAIAYELTLKRLVPATGEAFMIQTNAGGIVSTSS